MPLGREPAGFGRVLLTRGDGRAVFAATIALGSGLACGQLVNARLRFRELRVSSVEVSSWRGFT